MKEMGKKRDRGISGDRIYQFGFGANRKKRYDKVGVWRM